MWRSNDIVEEERPNLPSEVVLQHPEFQDAHSDETALHSISEPEGEEIEKGIEGGTDVKMDCKDKQNASQHVSQNLVNQNQTCQTDLPLKGIKGDLDPGSKPQRKLPCPRCERRFASSQGLQRHIQTHALSTCHTQRFKCSRCRRSFSTLFSRRRHEKRHENRNRKTDDLTDAPCTASQNVHGSAEPLNTASQNPEPNKCINAADGEQKDDKNNDVKASHVCKYCKKAFRTHTSLRRHQRRIHERHLLPRAVYKKVNIIQEPEGQQLVETAQDNHTANSQCVEDIDQEREYMVDISSNISENLSFYIDGKIVSTSAVSNCEVIEMNSGGSAVIGLNAVIISPAQISQALKLENNTSSFTSDLSGQSSTRRRTSTPPLLPQIKTELESESILSTSSSSLLSLTLSSMSGAPLVTAHLPQCIETVAFNEEKTVHLSPKLMQILQNQDGSKPTFALIADGQTVLPATTTRFKRRTTSPPSSPQQPPDVNIETQDQVSTKAKKSKLESHGLGNEEPEPLNSPINSSDGAPMQQQVLPLDCSVSRTGGDSCNQQPLDLSNSVVNRESNDALAESILDLSISGKSLDCDSAGVCLTQPASRKSKPNSSMLQKVLMNEYGGVDIPSVEAPAPAGLLSVPDITNLAVVAVSDAGPPKPEKFLFELALPPASINPAPSQLTPVSIHPTTPGPPPQCSPSSSPTFVSFLSTPTVEPSQDIQTLHSAFVVSENVAPTGSVEDCADNPVQLSQGDMKVTIPDWGSSALGGLETLIPAVPSLSLQSPHWVADPVVCELAQRTLVVDSVLASDAQIFSPSLPVNQSNITSLAFPTNTVVIEYTVAVQSTENILPALQHNSACLLNKVPVNALQQEPHVSPEPQPLSPDTNLLPETSTQSAPTEQSTSSTDGKLTLTASTSAVEAERNENGQEIVQFSDCSKQENKVEEELPPLHPFCKNFMCNVCEQPFQSMKILSQHVGEHSKEWPYKCEFCVQLFESDTGLLEHRSSYHGIGKIYVCKTCSKEFAFLCNLEQHQRDLHPGQECSHTEAVHGKLRPENHNNPKTNMADPGFPVTEIKQEPDNTTSKADKDSLDNTSEELFTTIKIMASGGVKSKGPDVRLGINQHYPSFKPPPFPYHNRTPTGTTATSATNFTTHNIPQTFSTAIRCTKCGKSFDNMPELHKHILACANASDKKRYTPKKNPIPLKRFAKAQNGVLSPARIVNSKQNFSQKVGQQKKQNFHESPVRIKMSILNKKKSQLVQRGRPAGGRKAFAQDDLGVFACPHCRREFTYNASLKKHVAFSCPMRPASRNSKKRTLSIVSAQENNGSLRRQIANMSAKPQGSEHGPKTITKNQIIKQNAAVDTTQDFRLKRSTILSTSVVQSNKKGKPMELKSCFMPQLASKQIVLSSVAQVNSQEPGVRVHVLSRKIEQRVGDTKIQPRREDRLSLRLRERVGPITRSVQQASTTTTVLKQPDSHNIIMHPVVLQVKK
uniref:PR domain containing 2, with ZNF domain a n=1 Tax=Cyprinus carpio TaxID=7962 RepID=A0A8C1VJ03_CYPCA